MNDENIYRTLFKELNQAVLVQKLIQKGKNIEVKFANKTAGEVFEFDHDDPATLDLKSIFDDKHYKDYFQLLYSLPERTPITHSSRININGKNYNIQLVSSKINLNNDKLVVSTARVIRNEADWQNNYQMIGKIMHTTEAGVIGISLINKIQFWNKGAENIFGYSEEEIFSKNANVLVPADRRREFNTLLNNSRKGEKLIRMEMEGWTKDGQRIHVAITITPFMDIYGNVLGMSLIARDISDKKHAEMELKKSHEQLRLLTKHIETVRENERKLIAIELHDELGQALTALSLDLSWLKKKITKDNVEAHAKLYSMHDYIDKTVELVSSITSQLRPTILDHFGLVPAIEWQAEEFKKRSGIDYNITNHLGEIELKENQQIVIFRIFQELLNNIIRHSKATKTKIFLDMSGDNLIMRVNDNGIGIKQDDINSPESFGILGIKERINSIDGTVLFVNKKNGGTNVTVIAPINN
jgi:PAS domain S-box-containing protein